MAEEESRNLSFTRHLNSLNDPNRGTRKRGLDGINKELFATQISEENVRLMYKEAQMPLLKCIHDPVEKCRELSIGIVSKYFEKYGDVELLMPALVPYLVQRLGQQDIVETSEELRLQLIQLTTAVIICAGKRNAVYLDDLVQILQRTIVDPYPEVKKESCNCASALAKATPENFHLQSESLIKPLLMSISHQHSRVRAAVVSTIGGRMKSNVIFYYATILVF